MAVLNTTHHYNTTLKKQPCQALAHYSRHAVPSPRFAWNGDEPVTYSAGQCKAMRAAATFYICSCKSGNGSTKYAQRKFDEKARQRHRCTAQAAPAKNEARCRALNQRRVPGDELRDLAALLDMHPKWVIDRRQNHGRGQQRRVEFLKA